MSVEMPELPEGWVETTFDAVSHINPNMTLEDEIEVSFLPMSGVPTMFLGNIQSEPRKWREVRKGYTPFQNGDTLFAKVTPCFENGKAVAVSGLSNGFGAGSTELFVLRPLGGISPKYLLGLVKTEEFLRRGAINMTGSVGLKRVPKDFVRTYSIPLAPLAEQKVIADKLDALLAQVDTLKARLDAIPAILKQFRQSVLSAAVTGKLTEEWSNQYHGPREYLDYPASLPPVIPTKIPARWKWVSVGDLASKVADGVHQKPNYVQSGIPFVTVKNLTAGRGIDFSQTNFITEADHVEFCKRTLPERDDILITKDGTLGVVRRIDTNVPFSIFVSLALVKPRDRRLSKYLELAFSSIQLQAQMIGVGTGLQHIHLRDLRLDVVPMPSIEEQTEIIRRVESLFAFADQIEARAQEATTRVKHLTQSILAKAFRGELTEEWRKAHPELVSGQNSAEALLEQIRAARAAAPDAKGKRGRKASSESDASLAMAAESEMVKKRGRPRKG